MKPDRPIVISADIDRVELDAHAALMMTAANTLEHLGTDGFALILCSSRTRAEIEGIQSGPGPMRSSPLSRHSASKTHRGPERCSELGGRPVTVSLSLDPDSVNNLAAVLDGALDFECSW